MVRVLVVSDDGQPTGYGRISMEVNTRLARRGYDVMAASLAYDGLLPPQLDGQRLPYFVASLAGHAEWPQMVANLIGVVQPDIVHVVQDAPYALQLYSLPVDWSLRRFVVTTPVDGAPIFKPWVETMKQIDGLLSISQFGVAAYRAAGVAAQLCRPGVDGNAFFRLPDNERAALRARLGLAPGAFVLGTACMNQGRKAVSKMLEGFFRFAADKPDARYLLDMDAVSLAGWDIPTLCAMYGWDAGKLIFRADAQRAGLNSLRERYAVMDAHVVLSHREGYGLPLAEAMACGVPSMALDYCSGPEIVGDGRGVLVKTIDYSEPGTWGGAEDRFPDLADFVARLQGLYDQPAERAAMAARGMAWARAQTWDAAADAVQALYDRAMTRQVAALPPEAVPHPPPVEPTGLPDIHPGDRVALPSALQSEPSADPEETMLVEAVPE